MSAHKGGGTRFAISDLHVEIPENCRLVGGLQPDSADDWLIVAGDTAETFADVEWALRTLRAKFGGVVYGRLHITRTTCYDGVRFEEVSLGYPREWRTRGGPLGLRRVFHGHHE